MLGLFTIFGLAIVFDSHASLKALAFLFIIGSSCLTVHCLERWLK